MRDQKIPGIINGMLRQGGGAQADQVRPGGHVPAARHNTRVGSFLLFFFVC